MSNSYPSHAVRSFRVEPWTEGSVDHVLVRAVMDAGAAHGQTAHAWLFRRDAATGEASCGHARLMGSGVLTVPRGEVVARMQARPALTNDYRLFGIPGCPALLATMVRHTITQGITISSRGAPQAEGKDWDEYAVGSVSRDTYLPASLQGAMGYPSKEASLPTSDIRIDDTTPPGWSFTGGIASFQDRGRFVADTEIEAVVRESLAAGTARIAAQLDPEANTVLGPRNWTLKGYAFYVAQGEVRGRRHQAARLYPALAPMIAENEHIHRLVDAGQPFEEELRDWLAGDILTPGDGLTMARLRRFRTLGNDVPFHGVAHLLHRAVRLPPDWLPGSREEWVAFGKVLEGTVRFIENRVQRGEMPGFLEDRTLFQGYGGDWRAYLAGVQPAEGTLRQALDDADDIYDHLHDTLLFPIARSLGDRLEDHEVRMESLVPLHYLGGRLLYDGKTLPAILRFSQEWHGSLDRLERDLPRSVADPSWPPLLKEPFAAPNGLRVVPLASSHQLRDEGGAGRDPNGVPGLDHCVGGYGRECFEGRTHILSVRRPMPDGGYERISTVEMRFYTEDAIEVVQHRGLRNAEPPHAAQAAVDELLHALDVDFGMVDPAARGDRGEQEFETGYDWRDPANLEAAFKAWAPWLPKPVAKAGLEGLKATVGTAIWGPAAQEADEDEGPSPGL